MKEVEKKARVGAEEFNVVLRCLEQEYGNPEHLLAIDAYYTMPRKKDGEKPRFRVRRNYDGDTKVLKSIMANTKRKLVALDGLENNVETEFQLADEETASSFLDMMTAFGAKYWYTKGKEKFVFVAKGAVEYHLELCTLPIKGHKEHFLEIEGVFNPNKLTEYDEEETIKQVDMFIDMVFMQLGIEKSVEPRPYRELMGVEYPSKG